MGQAWSFVTRPLRNYNLESRAHKIISKSTPAPAPKYNATLHDIERIKTDYPEAESELLQKNPGLEQRLRDVFVKSYDKEKNLEVEKKVTKNLPLNRKPVEDFEYGLQEPDVIPEGKVSLRQALKFISDHQEDPKINSIEHIANTYKLDQTLTSQILSNFKMYQLHIPATKNSQVVFGMPAESIKKLIENKQPKSE